MNSRILIAATLTTGVLVSACSQPTSQNGRNTDTNAAGAARQIELVDAPGGEVMLASDLEARRAPRLARIHPVERQAPTAATNGEADAKATHDHAMVATAAVVPEVSRTTSSMADAPLTLAAAPLPVRAPMPVAQTAGEGGPRAGDDADRQPEAGGRGPTIIIRGGMGSPHDDCKIHGPGARGPGMAINRIAPSFSGGGGSGRSGASTFPRGGIR